MPTDYRRVTDFLKQAVGDRQRDDLARFKPRHDPAPPKVPGGSEVSETAIDERWRLPSMPAAARAELADQQTLEQRERYPRNIENFIGTVKVPVGLAGPLRVNGLFAHGDFYVPLATTEAALVLNEGVSRAPGFAFATIVDASRFVMWATSAMDDFRRVVETTTKHGRLIDLQITVEGNRR